MSNIYLKTSNFLNKYSSATYTFLEVIHKQIREDKYKKNNASKKQIHKSPTSRNLFNNGII